MLFRRKDAKFAKKVLIMGHNIDLCEAMFVAWDTVFNTGRIDHKLKEVIRVQLSRRASDRYFAGLRSAKARDDGLVEAAIAAGCDDYERSPRFSEAEKWALRYADQTLPGARSRRVSTSSGTCLPPRRWSWSTQYGFDRPAR